MTPFLDFSKLRKLDVLEVRFRRMYCKDGIDWTECFRTEVDDITTTPAPELANSLTQRDQQLVSGEGHCHHQLNKRREQLREEVQECIMYDEAQLSSLVVQLARVSCYFATPPGSNS